MLLRLSRCFASFKAGLASEVPLNSFKSVEFNGKTILLTKTGEKVHAISSKCTHWGVPLSAGYVDSNTAYCPAHCAGFDLKTGHSTCSPGLDSLPIYSTSIDSNGEVIVEVPDVPNFDEPIRR